MMRIKLPSLSVVVPCFNEAAVLEELRNRLVPVCNEAVGNNFEIVLVDDGSTDATRRILERFHAEDPHFVAVMLSRNHGHQLALTAGLSVARGARVLVLDADLQDPPELLPAMMATMEKGFDVVYGRRRDRKGETAIKVGTAALFYRLLDRIVDVKIPMDSGDFRLMSRRVVETLLQMPEQHRFIRGMISWIGYPQTALDYDRDPRWAGETKYNLKAMVRFALDAITGFSIVPLKIATWLGFLVSVLSAVMSAFVLISWIGGRTVPGWTSLTLVTLILGGVQLFVVGILGEYVGRLYMQSKGRPLFVIDQVYRAESCFAEQPPILESIS
jgi:dolichol-phosphate mannosyltransferase